MLSQFVKEAIFPRYCFSCHRLGSYLCPLCVGKLSLIEKDICPYCKKGSFFGLTHPDCQRFYRLDGLKALFFYNDTVKKIIKNIKYQLVKQAIDDFLQTISKEKVNELLFYKRLAKELVILPVPLHKNRLKKRGFNQSEEMAKFFSQALRFSMTKNFLIRTKNTKPQAQLKESKERYRNIRGAFSLAKEAIKNVEKKNFIIFDDVWTSGLTVKEMARVLKGNGANKVFALTIAR